MVCQLQLRLRNDTQNAAYFFLGALGAQKEWKRVSIPKNSLILHKEAMKMAAMSARLSSELRKHGIYYQQLARLKNPRAE
jgi:hypothetical protein